MSKKKLSEDTAITGNNFLLETRFAFLRVSIITVVGQLQTLDNSQTRQKYSMT